MSEVECEPLPDRLGISSEVTKVASTDAQRQQILAALDLALEVASQRPENSRSVPAGTTPSTTGIWFSITIPEVIYRVRAAGRLRFCLVRSLGSELHSPPSKTLAVASRLQVCKRVCEIFPGAFSFVQLYISSAPADRRYVAGQAIRAEERRVCGSESRGLSGDRELSARWRAVLARNHRP
jgi:hypothetical protein